MQKQKQNPDKTETEYPEIGVKITEIEYPKIGMKITEIEYPEIGVKIGGNYAEINGRFYYLEPIAKKELTKLLKVISIAYEYDRQSIMQNFDIIPDIEEFKYQHLDEMIENGRGIAVKSGDDLGVHFGFDFVLIDNYVFRMPYILVKELRNWFYIKGNYQFFVKELPSKAKKEKLLYMCKAIALMGNFVAGFKANYRDYLILDLSAYMDFLEGIINGIWKNIYG